MKAGLRITPHFQGRISAGLQRALPKERMKNKMGCKEKILDSPSALLYAV